MAKSSKPSDDPKKRRPADDDRPAKKKARARDEEDEDEDEDEEDEPEAPKKPRKKRKSANNPWRMVSYVGGGIGGFIALVFFFYWVYSPVGADPKLLCYCPPETFSIEGMDVEEIQKNSKMKDIFDRSIQRFKAYGNEKRFKDAGFTEKEVQYYLNCAASGDWEKEKDYDPQDRRGSLTMFRFKEPLDQTKFLGSYTDASVYRKEEKSSRDGKKYYQLYQMVPTGADRHLEPLYDVSFFFPNDRTLIIGSTRKELEEAMNRTPGKVEIDQTMRDLVDNTDGHYFKAYKNLTVRNTALLEKHGPSMMSAGFMDESMRNPETLVTIAIGSATWIASDGNNFLMADGTLFIDKATAKRIYASTADSIYEMKSRFFREDAKVGDKENMFATGKKESGGDGKKKEEISDALTDYFKKSSVGRRGNMVYVEGRVSHEKFNKMWSHISDVMLPLPQTGGGMMGGMGMGGGPGMGMPGPPPGGPPGAPMPMPK
ncbi:hypothetical protein [Zavarzinella formosa]|uniref:hypothetical protein n=1 Tax=Zavarzinella formosa TaxID=360055 RepID=UPI0003008E2E|nr:hypothetical protein [Zavarzinella formosa]